MSRKYTCPECQNSFDDTTAVCIDWRDPNRAFGCPHCETFFHKVRNRKIDWHNLVAVSCTGGIWMGAMTGLVQAAKNQQSINVFLFATILILSGVVYNYVFTRVNHAPKLINVKN